MLSLSHCYPFREAVKRVFSRWLGWFPTDAIFSVRWSPFFLGLESFSLHCGCRAGDRGPVCHLGSCRQGTRFSALRSVFKAGGGDSLARGTCHWQEASCPAAASGGRQQTSGRCWGPRPSRGGAACLRCGLCPLPLLCRSPRPPSRLTEGRHSLLALPWGPGALSQKGFTSSLENIGITPR